MVGLWHHIGKIIWVFFAAAMQPVTDALEYILINSCLSMFQYLIGPTLVDNVSSIKLSNIMMIKKPVGAVTSD